jgi:hypothetical protein
MENILINLEFDTESQIRGLVSTNLSDEDIEWFADWLLRIDIGKGNVALEKHPDLTLGDLMGLRYFKH